MACRVKNGDWVPGVILRHWWRAPKWPPGKIGPYQVCLDNDTVIGVPLDNPSIIRLSKVSLPPKASLRFKVSLFRKFKPFSEVIYDIRITCDMGFFRELPSETHKTLVLGQFLGVFFSQEYICLTIFQD